MKVSHAPLCGVIDPLRWVWLFPPYVVVKDNTKLESYQYVRVCSSPKASGVGKHSVYEKVRPQILQYKFWEPATGYCTANSENHFLWTMTTVWLRAGWNRFPEQHSIPENFSDITKLRGKGLILEVLHLTWHEQFVKVTNPLLICCYGLYIPSSFIVIFCSHDSKNFP